MLSSDFEHVFLRCQSFVVQHMIELSSYLLVLETSAYLEAAFERCQELVNTHFELQGILNLATEVELDKLLRTVPGEGVLSIQLLHHTNLIGHSIDEIFANSEQPPVYALSRGDRMMWNPDLAVQLRYDDVLICYGELESLRSTLRKAVLMSPPISSDSPTSEETNA